MRKLHYLLAIAQLLGLAGCAPKAQSHKDACVYAAQDESAITACQADAHCQTTAEDWARYQRHTNWCLQR
jgi:hypothetical protein